MTSTAPPLQHVAVIMDGNGRWAEEQGLPRLAGHREGARVVRDITTHCRELGIRWLTLYAFSSENWARPDDEVGGLMELLRQYLQDELPTLKNNGVRLRSIGDASRLPLLVRTLLESTKQATANETGMTLTLALSYSGRNEIVAAARALAHEVQAGQLEPGAITADVFATHLQTAGMPDPDLLIRTSGEMRISNFLLWQVAYSELWVTDVAWPDFTRRHFDDALAAFKKRQRRYGKTGAQLRQAAPRPGAPRRGAAPRRGEPA